jgi:hypothetical protein
MKSTAETPEVPPTWATILRRQGRTMTWLAQQTGKTYPQVRNYYHGNAKAPDEWLDRVEELLGETVR